MLPFATEEVWSWWREGSVHRAPWPTPEPLREAAGDADAAVVAAAGAALAALRKVKSEAKVSMRTPITAVTLTVPTATRSAVELALGDVRAAGRVTVMVTPASPCPYRKGMKVSKALAGSYSLDNFWLYWKTRSHRRFPRILTHPGPSFPGQTLCIAGFVDDRFARRSRLSAPITLAVRG